VSPQIRVHKIAAKRAKHQNLDEIRETNDLLKFCQKILLGGACFTQDQWNCQDSANKLQGLKS
jgi:hypothetical protein